MVELPPPFTERYPHELSGVRNSGSAWPVRAAELVVLCDEVTSALDTIVGANVIELQIATPRPGCLVCLHQP